MVKLATTTSKLSAKLNHEPSPFEIAEAMETTVAEVLKLQLHNQLQPTSLSAPSALEGEREVGETIPDPVDGFERVNQSIDDKNYLTKVFGHKQLSLQEKYILSFRLGFELEELMGTSIETRAGTVKYEDLLDHLNSAKGTTLEDASLYLGVTRERIRQIEKKGLEKIREAYQRGK